MAGVQLDLRMSPPMSWLVPAPMSFLPWRSMARIVVSMALELAVPIAPLLSSQAMLLPAVSALAAGLRAVLALALMGLPSSWFAVPKAPLPSLAEMWARRERPRPVGLTVPKLLTADPQ